LFDQVQYQSQGGLFTDTREPGEFIYRIFQ